ncbi:hypothetical protein WR25_15531 [Diploscapter pachys]|uniref:Uncharacterized protein n=1 Tax=Diploscapter pachys TaxID=2018661 RepID=A0A2A2JHS0_9BILA|nr:hypothetical protein WR25_15531 [Diploscapter pachys]
MFRNKTTPLVANIKSENKDVALVYATMLALIQKGLQKDVIQETKPILPAILTTSNRNLPEPMEEGLGSENLGGSEHPEIVSLNSRQVNQQNDTLPGSPSPSQAQSKPALLTSSLGPNRSNRLSPTRSTSAVSGVSRVSRVSNASNVSRRSRCPANNMKLSTWRDFDAQLVQHSKDLISNNVSLQTVVAQHKSFWKKLTSTCCQATTRNNQHQRLMVEFTMKLVRAYEFLMLCGVDEICTQPLDLFNVAISKFVVRPSSLYASSLSWIQAKEIFHTIIDSVNSFSTVLQVNTVFAELSARFASTWAEKSDDYKGYYAFVVGQLAELQIRASGKLTHF